MGARFGGFKILIENVHNQFLRTITGLRKSTPIYMLQAGLGRYQIDICIKSRMIGFWVSIIDSPGNKISKILYNFLSNEKNVGHMNKWMNYIKVILISVGKINLFYQNYVSNPNVLKSSILHTFKDLNIPSWNSKLLDKGRHLVFISMR